MATGRRRPAKMAGGGTVYSASQRKEMRRADTARKANIAARSTGATAGQHGYKYTPATKAQALQRAPTIVRRRKVKMPGMGGTPMMRRGGSVRGRGR